MKKFNKIIFTTVFFLCCFVFFTLNSNASEISSAKGIIIDERMSKYKEAENEERYDLNGCYTSGWFGKDHHHTPLARIFTYYGIYDYHNKEEDTITVFCYSWMQSELRNGAIQNKSSQNIRLHMPKSDMNGDYIHGSEFPKTEYGNVSETISVGSQTQYSNSEVSPSLTINYSVSHTSSELGFYISTPDGEDTCDSGYQWNFTIHGNRKSLYTNIVSYSFVIKNASSHKGESIDIRFGFWHECMYDNKAFDTGGHPNDKIIKSEETYKIEG